MATNGNGDRARFDWLHLLLGLVTLALMVTTVSSGLLGGRVSVDSENEFRDMVKRRLNTLEAADSRNIEALDRHREQDRKDVQDLLRDIGEIKQRLSEIQARIKDLERARYPNSRSSYGQSPAAIHHRRKFKPIAPHLHEVLRAYFQQVSHERPRIGTVEE